MMVVERIISDQGELVKEVEMRGEIKKEYLKLSLDEIKPYPNNPRNNEEAIKDVIESIRQCGNLDPIEVDEDGVILSGHTRLEALKALKYTETDAVRYTGMTEEEKKKYRLLANKTGEKATWDFEKLELELDGMDFDGYDFGFEMPNEEEETEIIEDEAPTLEEIEEFRVKPGDIFDLGGGASTDMWRCYAVRRRTEAYAGQ